METNNNSVSGFRLIEKQKFLWQKKEVSIKKTITYITHVITKILLMFFWKVIIWRSGSQPHHSWTVSGSSKQVYSSFPVLHKVGNVDILVLYKSENKMVIDISDFTFNSKHCNKFALKLISLLTVSNLFPLDFVQKCQHCQLCMLRENSTGQTDLRN